MSNYIGNRLQQSFIRPWKPSCAGRVSRLSIVGSFRPNHRRRHHHHHRRRRRHSRRRGAHIKTYSEGNIQYVIIFQGYSIYDF